MTNPLAGILKLGMVLFLANEIRGFILAAPVLLAMYHSGGSLMALYLGFCSLAGIALSVLGPVLIAKKVTARLRPREI